MKAFYNEFDSFPAQWLRNLIDAGLIAPGEVDERSIEDVTPTDLAGYDRCHFFAGIAGWERALQLAGWPAEWPVWTGSCPCQPFSSAGKGGRGTDERHLWPAWFHLIRVCRPPVIFGEQVASKDGLKWLDLVCADLEAEGYAIGAADLPACGVGAPHIRQRLWFVGYAESFRPASALHDPKFLLPAEGTSPANGCEDVGILAIPEIDRPFGQETSSREIRWGAAQPCMGSETSFWHDCQWLPCRDGKFRPTKPGLSPLAHGVRNRVGKLRAIGNSIVPQVAAEFIKAVMEDINCKA